MLPVFSKNFLAQEDCLKLFQLIDVKKTIKIANNRNSRLNGSLNNAVR
jgi:hypothetical protein